MEQTLAVRVGEAGADLCRVIDHDGFGEPSVVLDHLGERRSVDELHDDEVGVVFVTDVVDVDDVGMREFGGVMRFSVKALDEIFVLGELRAQLFDGDAAA